MYITPGCGQPRLPSGHVTASLLMTFSVDTSRPVLRAASSTAARKIEGSSVSPAVLTLGPVCAACEVADPATANAFAAPGDSAVEWPPTLQPKTIARPRKGVEADTIRSDLGVCVVLATRDSYRWPLKKRSPDAGASCMQTTRSHRFDPRLPRRHYGARNSSASVGCVAPPRLPAPRSPLVTSISPNSGEFPVNGPKSYTARPVELLEFPGTSLGTP